MQDKQQKENNDKRLNQEKIKLKTKAKKKHVMLHLFDRTLQLRYFMLTLNQF